MRTLKIPGTKLRWYHHPLLNLQVDFFLLFLELLPIDIKSICYTSRHFSFCKACKDQCDRVGEEQRSSSSPHLVHLHGCAPSSEGFLLRVEAVSKSEGAVVMQFHSL